MNIEEIYDNWEKDSEIDSAQLDHESLKTVKLFTKYYKMYITEYMIYKKLDAEYKVLYTDARDYYSGDFDDELLKKYNWEPYQKIKPLLQHMESVIQSNKTVIAHVLKLELQKQKCDFLEAVIKMIKDRQWQIKNAIEFAKFKMGA